MGFSLLILLAAVAIGFYFRGQLGLLNLFATLGNSATARFQRRDDVQSGAEIFDVTPARSSLMFILVMGGASIGGTYFLLSRESGFANLLGVVLALIAIPLFLYPLLTGARYRKSVRLTVANGVLSDGSRSYPVSGITEFAIRKTVKVNEEPVGTLVVGNAFNTIIVGKSTTTMIGRSLGQRQAARSYVISVRTRQSSDEGVLCGGLTKECAEALAQDLNRSISVT
jgi:hypothetical protein